MKRTPNQKHDHDHILAFWDGNHLHLRIPLHLIPMIDSTTGENLEQAQGIQLGLILPRGLSHFNLVSLRFKFQMQLLTN